MKVLLVLPLCVVLTTGQFLYDTFDDGFFWATSTSAHQIEGGWDADGKGENIWDRKCNTGGIADNQTANVACDSYHLYMDDVAILKNLEVDYYRFSIAWSRILPDGTLAGGINQPGIDYYNNLINALLAENIQPMVTLYHWDLPQPLQDIGGWENETLIPHFVDYSNICFESFSDRVKLWMTFNEPWNTAWLGYGSGVFAPGVYNPGWAPYRVTHTILKAHAETYHLYDEQYRPTQGGRISISLDSDWKEPIDSTQDNIDASLRALEFKLGWYANPIFGTGDYPPIVRQLVDAKSAAQGFNQSRLPTFTQAEIDRMKGTYDYFGLNHYTTQLVTNEVRDCLGWDCDSDHSESIDPSWPETGSSWLKMVPWGLRKLLVHIKDSYGDVPIFVTENGCSDRNASMQDDFRVNWYRQYINAVLQANKTDNVNTMGYTAWSLMDNFEWAIGFYERFGIHYVNFSDPARPRTPKLSATAYTQIIRDNGFVEPSPNSGTHSMLPYTLGVVCFLLVSLARIVY